MTGGNRMKMRDRKLTRRQALVAYWLPLTLIIALLGILLALWLGAPKSEARPPGVQGPILPPAMCKTVRAERQVDGTLGELYWAKIAFPFCTSTRTGAIFFMPAPRPHWGLGDWGRITGWHADGICGKGGPRFTDHKNPHHRGRLWRKFCYGEIGGKRRSITFTITFHGQKGGPPWSAVSIDG